MELAKAYVQLVPSMQGMQGSISRLMNGEAGGAGISAGRLMGGKMVKMLTGVVSAAAIGKTISSAITEGANLEQSIGGIETLFKGSANKVVANAKQAYKTAGLSANQYMEQTTSFAASLLQATGQNADKAADIANMAMIDMSDNANKMGTNIQDIQNAYQGFAKQNYTMLDNLKLGYGGTKQEMERLLADAEKLTGVKYDINNLSDVYEAIHAIQGKLEITGATAEEAEKTFSGSFNAMKAAASNLLGNMALGENVEAEVRSLLKTTSTFVFGNLLPMLWNLGKSTVSVVGQLIKEAVPTIMQSVNEIFPQLVDGFGNGLAGLFEQASQIVPQFLNGITESLPSVLDKGVEIVLNLVNGILENLPTLITTAGQLVTQFALFISQNIPTIWQAGVNLILGLVQGIISNLPAIVLAAIDAVANFVLTIAQNLPQIWQKGGEIIWSLIKGIIGMLPSLLAAGAQLLLGLLAKIIEYLPKFVKAGFDLIISLAKGIIDKIADAVGAMDQIGKGIVDKISSVNLFDIGANMIRGLWNGIGSVKDWIFGKIGGFANSLTAKVKSAFGIHSPSRVFRDQVGAMLGKGLALGIEDEMSSVSKSLSSMEDLVSNYLGDTFEYRFKAIDVTDGLPEVNNPFADYSKDINNLTRNRSAELDINQISDIQYLFEMIGKILDKLDELIQKDPDTYLDEARVSRELSDPIRKQQALQNMMSKRMRGAW